MPLARKPGMRKPVPAMILLAALLLAAAPDTSSAVTRLSDEATVSLLTMWPGTEIYLSFGHSAFRVRDPQRRIDLVFNYGTFDLRDPLFVPKFVKGYLHYFLAYYPFTMDFEYDKKTENRRWREQVLNLDTDQVNALYAFLVDNAKPQNRYYYYDFIRDNCATRIRDAMLTVFGSEVSFDPGDTQNPGKSFRQMIGECVSDRPFYNFMFSFVLGTAADRKVSSFESQFLPLYMMRVFDSSTIVRGDETVPLVRSSAVIYEPPTVTIRGKAWADPSFVLWPFALIVVLLTGLDLYRLFARKLFPVHVRAWRAVDGVVFIGAGIFGCLVDYLSFLSIHTAAKANLNALWLLPTSLVAAVFLMRKKQPPAFVAWYLLVAGVLCLVPLVSWPVWPQEMHPSLSAAMLLIAVRSVWHFIAWRQRSRTARTSG
jgi:hypothetical protein